MILLNMELLYIDKEIYKVEKNILTPVNVLGSEKLLGEFLNIDDLEEALLSIEQKNNDTEPINIESGEKKFI